MELNLMNSLKRNYIWCIKFHLLNYKRTNKYVYLSLPSFLSLNKKSYKGILISSMFQSYNIKIYSERIDIPSLKLSKCIHSKLNNTSHCQEALEADALKFRERNFIIYIHSC